ncbi:MAG: acyl-CoA carboxylase subunit beta [Acidimicrobiales bacterium]
MVVLCPEVDRDGERSALNRSAMLGLIAEMEGQMAAAASGGGQRYAERHKMRGKLLVRERVELLVDAGSAFLELMALAAYGTDSNVGASVVTGIGVVESVECMVVAHDPTVKGGATNPFTLAKVLRAAEIARENRLPLVYLVESAGADLASQAQVFVPGGRVFRDLTELSAAGVPTLSIVFGSSTAGGAYVPGMSDYVVMVKNQAKVFLGGPPLVRMATGEDAEEESLGGAEMHARVSGLADYLATDEEDAIRAGRQVIANLNWRKLGPGARPWPEEPLFAGEGILDMIPRDLRLPLDPYQVLARVLDGSRFEEFKPLYGTSLVTGWGAVHGYPVGVLANARGVLFNEEAEKAAQFIQLANQVSTPLLFFQNTTGYMVGAEYERRGIVKDGAKMINAVCNSTVPHITMIIGSSYGAGNYGMCGRAFGPRFLFAWPNARSAVMGGDQLAGVLSIVARQSAASSGRDFDEDADRQRADAVRRQIDVESTALSNSSRLYDDGIIDPRDTRTVLGICLSAVDSNEVAGARHYGVFRM